MTLQNAIEAANRAEAAYVATAIVYGHGHAETSAAFRAMCVADAKAADLAHTEAAYIRQTEAELHDQYHYGQAVEIEAA